MFRGIFFNPLIVVLIFAGALGACFGDKESGEAETNNTQPSEPTIQRTETPPPVEEKERNLIIGVVGPTTGEEASYGKKIVDGVMLAAKRFNAKGGIGNKKIKVIHYNTKSEQGRTSDSVSSLIDQGVIAILAAPTGWATFAPILQMNSTHTIFFSVGSKRRIARSGPFIFRMALSDEVATKGIISYSKKQGHRNYVLITSSVIDFSLDESSMFKIAIMESGGKIVADVDTYDTYLGQSNLKGAVESVKKSPEPIDAIVYTGNASEGADLAKALRAAGIKAPIIGGEELFTKEYLEKGGKAVGGTILYATFSPESPSPGVKTFIKDYKSELGKEPDKFSALAYDTFLMVVNAIEQAGSTRPSEVRTALLSEKGFEGVTGRTVFGPRGEPVKSPFLYVVAKDGSRFTFLE